MVQDEVKVTAKFNPAFLSFFNNDKFYKILYGSAGSSKSFSTAQKIVKRCIEEHGHRVWAFRKVSTYVDASVYDTIKTVIDSFGVTHMVTFNKTQKTITFPHTDCVIRCAGLDDQEKIKSITKITIAWLEELTEFDEQDFNQLSLRMRGHFPYYRELIGTFNPVSELHWVKKKFFDEVNEGMKSKLFLHHSTFKDNFFLGKDYISRLENDYSHDPNNYRIYVLGQWGKVVTGMEFYKNFNSDIHVKEVEWNPNMPVHISFDFNVVPYMSATIWQVGRSKDEKGNLLWKCNCLKEVALKHPKNSTEDISYYIEQEFEDWVYNGIVLYGDASGRARKTSSKSTDYMIIEEILGRYIIENRVPRSNPGMSERHNFISRAFYGSFPIEINIDPSCKYLIQDLTHVLEDGSRNKIKKTSRDPVSKMMVETLGHHADTLDYFLMSCFNDMVV